MSATRGASLAAADIDAVALKPAEMAIDRARELDVSLLTVDYEGQQHVPDYEGLRRLADDFEVRLTVPVRATGFDPFGENRLAREIPENVGQILVAGHEAYLDEIERSRPVAPRLRAAVEQAEDPWVGTENIERLALAVGGMQFELLSGSTEREVRTLRAAGYDGGFAVYAPTVLTDDEDAILDAVGAYAARREPVRRALPDGAATDSTATGDARETLLAACREYALVGKTVGERVDRLREAGVDRIVAYPARGIDAVL